MVGRRPEGIEEFLAFHEIPFPGPGIEVPFAETDVKLFVFGTGDLAADDVDLGDEGVGFR